METLYLNGDNIAMEHENEVDKVEIKDIQVLETIKDGKSVYQA